MKKPKRIAGAYSQGAYSYSTLRRSKKDQGNSFEPAPESLLNSL